MKCRHSVKYRPGYVQCQKDGSVRKESCKENCHQFKPTLWYILMYLIFNGRRWGN